jgi:hypothetical protein
MRTSQIDSDQGLTTDSTISTPLSNCEVATLSSTYNNCNKKRQKLGSDTAPADVFSKVV